MTLLRTFLLKLPIRKKLFIAYSFAFLLYFILGNLILYFSVRHVIEGNIEEQLKNNTESILKLVRTSADMGVRNYLRGVAEKNRDLAQHYYSQAKAGLLTQEQAKQKTADAMLSQIIGKTGYVYSIDSAGVIQTHPRQALLGEDLSEYPFIRAQMAKKEGFIEYDWANPGEKKARPKALYMTYFKPWDWIISASSYRDEFKDLINVHDFRKSILSTKFGKTGYPYVMDGSGTLIIHPALEGENIAESTDSSGRKFIKEILRKKDGSIIYPWKNPGEPAPRDKLVLFNYIPEYDWIVASSSYLGEFYEPLRILTYSTFFLAGAMLLLLLPITWQIAASITRPLESLMQGFQAGARGDLSTRVQEGRGGELGELAGYYNLFMDKLVESQGRLRRSEEQYRTLFFNAVEGVYQVRPSGEFLKVNPAMANLFGYESPESFIKAVNTAHVGNKDPGFLFADPEQKQQFVDHLEQARLVSGYEVQFRRKDNTKFWGVISARGVYDEDDALLFIEGLVLDVTQQHEAREALRLAKEEAEAATHLKSDFLSMISHEMRTPLTSVVGYARLLRKNLAKIITPGKALSEAKKQQQLTRMQEGVEVMITESDRLTALINDLMDLNKLEAGKAQFELTPVSANELLLATDAGMRPEVEAKGLRFIVEDSGVLPDIMGDMPRLGQVLSNLVSNAVKFTEQGEIRLRARVLDNAVEFCVQDTGPGIPEEHRKRLFERFFQIGEVLTGKPSGSGLGLAICRLLIEGHNGEIYVDSAPRKGSTFCFTLPLAGAE